MDKGQIGVIGLGVMGRNLALNIEEHGYRVSVYNRSSGKTKEFMERSGGRNIAGLYSIQDFTESLEVPRKIIIMVKAGEAVDETIKQLVPYLSEGDVLLDCGNSYYMDTIRRSRELADKGIFFLGTGISGGEEGARRGPSIMPGGDEKAYEMVEPILKGISAKADGEPCCTYIGKDGAGHFVKMVHNGIEYADMQLICEAYFLMKKLLNMSAQDMYETFREWNKGELNSYLIDITSEIFKKLDPDTGKYMIDIILDVAEQKGTGKWASQAALDMDASISTITESVFQRYISSLKEERMAASILLKGPSTATYLSGNFVESIRKALYASKICSYAQGFSLLTKASEIYDWKLKLNNIAAIFRGGCIIRAQFLNNIKEIYENNPELKNLLLGEYFKNTVAQYQQEWRKVVSHAVLAGIPVPGFASALSYYDSYRAGELPMNLLQAQRDYFGAHGYRRIDKDGIFHTRW